MHVALYYPSVVPPPSWVKQSLLLFDAVSSIVPPGFDLRGEPDLHFMDAEGLWRRAEVDPSIGDFASFRAEVRNALDDFARDDRYLIGLDNHGPTTLAAAPDERLARIYLGKLGDLIENDLAAAGLSRQSGRGYLEVHEEVADTVLAITARRLASDTRDPAERIVTSTDSGRAYRDAFGPTELRNRAECTALLLEGMLPTPDEATSIPDVVDFRDRHSKEVMEFRVALNDLARRIATSTDPVTALGDCVDELRSAKVQVDAAARQRGLILRATGAVALVGGSALAASGLAEPAALWAFQGAGVFVASELIRATAARPGQPEPFAFLHKAELAFGGTLPAP